MVLVVNGKGGKRREVLVFPGREEAVYAAIQGKEPDVHVFDRISGALDIHSYRRQFAQTCMSCSLTAHCCPKRDG
ncbi:hypothetical protein KSF_074380 [Reticulibacter mediterranei]|uniref:Uncharacterized protein n=1 Tax=Reticulibacter mediterranei TaxID=2778369 RepID=A0A8J3N6G2_9CHLR|nr:hypothetical protein KSF_074380 [Reticulibacter mediterranei]